MLAQIEPDAFVFIRHTQPRGDVQQFQQDKGDNERICERHRDSQCLDGQLHGMTVEETIRSGGIHRCGCP